MKGLLKVLVHPDREEPLEGREIPIAANLLQIGEFQLIQLAYNARFGKDMSEHVSSRIFADFMVGRVPDWALEYARRIILLDELGDLDDLDPGYHRYDSDGGREVRKSYRIAIAAVCIMVAYFTLGIAVGEFFPKATNLQFPPYADEPQSQTLPDDTPQ
jgi:hypothetical protein